jgi:glycosyltransferase involved in cell wall biosynthesis
MGTGSRALMTERQTPQTGPRTLSIVLPAFNEVESLPRVIGEYRRVMADRENCELIIVDNGSTDGTLEMLEAEQNKDPIFQFRIIRIDNNIGYGNGIMAGLKAADGEYLAWSHADFQCPPEDPFRLFDTVMAHPSPKSCFGKGRRTNDRGKMKIFPMMHTFFSDLILGHHLEEINAQPKLFHRSFLDEFRHPPDTYELDVYAYDKAVATGKEIVAVDVIFQERIAGESKWAYSTYSFTKFMVRNLLYLMKLRLFRRSI